MQRAAVIILLLLCAGCGTTISRSGTEQLLASDAIDRAVAGIDFSVLRGRTVYLDTRYLRAIKGIGFVNADYIISSLRQQLIAHRCLIKDDQSDADYVVEARVGALGSDGHEITYGLPASKALSSAASLLPNSPPVPTIPEISVARKDDQSAAAKVSVFAYHRESGEPVWQSGVSLARSSAKDTWVLGAGPFQKGTIYNDERFAGSRIRIPFSKRRETANAHPRDLAYMQPREFSHPDELDAPEDEPPATAEVVPASHEEQQEAAE